MDIFEAVDTGNLYGLRAAIANGANVNARRERSLSQETPLHVAVSNDHREIVQEPLDQPVDVNAVNGPNRETPLHYAARRGSVELIQLLLTKGANINAVDQYNRTPLHIAAQCNNFEIVQELITNGANLRARDISGQYPFVNTLLIQDVRRNYTDRIIAGENLQEAPSLNYRDPENSATNSFNSEAITFYRFGETAIGINQDQNQNGAAGPNAQPSDTARQQEEQDRQKRGDRSLFMSNTASIPSPANNSFSDSGIDIVAFQRALNLAIDVPNKKRERSIDSANEHGKPPAKSNARRR